MSRGATRHRDGAAAPAAAPADDGGCNIGGDTGALTAVPLLANHIAKDLDQDHRVTVVSPDAGGGKLARRFAKIALGQVRVVSSIDKSQAFNRHTKGVEWLEGWLDSFQGAMIVVSHDRYFLDHVTESTWEVAFAGLECYPGSYAKYLGIKAQRHLELSRRWEAQQQHITKTQEFIRIHIAGQRTKEARGRRKRTIFAVGDEKQSIFSFQGAAPREFDAPVRCLTSG